MGSRLARWRGLAGIGWRRVHHRLSRGGSRQTLVSVLGIALPVALLLLVVSVSLGLTGDVGTASGIDYWIVPEGAGSAVTSVGGAQLGAVHPTADSIDDRPGVRHASPMLIDFVTVEGDDGERVQLLAVGIIPADIDARIAPIPTGNLTNGDPYFANGTYNGTWPGEVVLSESAATTTGVSGGGTVNLTDTPQELRVTSVETPSRAGLAQFPIAVMHLSVLQELTGASEDDSADQIVVVAPDAAATTETALADIYPKTTVQTRGGLLSQRGSESELPAAVALAAFLITLTTGILLISTAFGFELAAESERRQVLSALGLAGRSRAGLIGTELGVVSLYGGGLGVLLWAGIGFVINWLTTTRFGAPAATLSPRLVVYGFAAAMLVGLLSLPYLLVVSWRSGGDSRLR